MTTPRTILTTQAHLQAVQREHWVTLNVLGIVVEQLLALTGGETVEIADSALADAPDLQAWRNAARSTVELAVSR
jgi:hypothetical protein